MFLDLSSLESNTSKSADKPVAIIIKGNPKYLEKDENRSKADDFYSEIKKILEAKGYRVEFDAGEPETTPDKLAKVWVGHSRGVDRLKWAPEGVATVKLDTLNPTDGDSPDHYVLSDQDKKHLEAIKEYAEATLEANQAPKRGRNRKAAEKVMLDVISSICPGNPNVAMYQELFDPKSPKYLNDAMFHDWMERMRRKEGALIYIDPPGSKFKLDVDRNVKELGPKYGIEFMQQLWYQDETGDWFLTPNVYLVLPFPVRRQAQLLVEKISIPENNNSIDDMTGQVTGASRGGKISYPELSLLKAFGMKKTIEEFMHWRGGDVKGHRIMNQQILKTGGASMDALAPYAGEVESTRTLANILLGMHYDNTL